MYLNGNPLFVVILEIRFVLESKPMLKIEDPALKRVILHSYFEVDSTINLKWIQLQNEMILIWLKQE